eukprot:CAMPEP_0174361978 /NCGR_PEP_ID=MMETSP0811_2-20130205/62000_1 /TAXON_ID=73025 ORGANISM="Eutreptiella gymnastica-like, Strain CCMP1594" /NCGR_SAMPLE_ID=MMETSP0811_2 /ASSEMBLY_ACC=CAM_ASM_000667 /LENGTH=56 /DNA_ID=CAMNT_0015499153 /DNA_START=702 /DNA_END=869 /DNA_ORIENTATION=+
MIFLRAGDLSLTGSGRMIGCKSSSMASGRAYRCSAGDSGFKTWGGSVCLIFTLHFF